MILGIYGAGGLGRDLLVLAYEINKIENRWDDIVFIDDTEGVFEVKGTRAISFNVAITLYTNKDLEFIIGVGEPRYRKLLREKVIKAEYTLTCLIHPSAMVSERGNISSGTIVCYNSFISCDVKIGVNVLIQPLACIGHNCQIGNDSVISTFVNIAGGCVIGNETYIGMQVPIKESTKIGNNTIIGMGSVVIKDIPDEVIAFGCPAKVVRENIDKKVFNKKN